MRILVTVEPTMYRETLAHVLRTSRLDDEVRLANSRSLEREATSFHPHMVVCSEDAPEIRGVTVPSRVVLRYHDGLNASVYLDEQEARHFHDMTVEDLIGVVDETQRLVLNSGTG